MQVSGRCRRRPNKAQTGYFVATLTPTRPLHPQNPNGARQPPRVQLNTRPAVGWVGRWVGGGGGRGGQHLILATTDYAKWQIWVHNFRQQGGARQSDPQSHWETWLSGSQIQWGTWQSIIQQLIAFSPRRLETVKWQRRTILNSFKMELLQNLSTNSDIIHFLFPRHPALEESKPSTAHIMFRKITIFFTERNILILSKMHSSNLFQENFLYKWCNYVWIRPKSETFDRKIQNLKRLIEKSKI